MGRMTGRARHTAVPGVGLYAADPGAVWLGVAPRVPIAAWLTSLGIGMLLGVRTAILVWVGGALFDAYVLFTVGIGLHITRSRRTE